MKILRNCLKLKHSFFFFTGIGEKPFEGTPGLVEKASIKYHNSKKHLKKLTLKIDFWIGFVLIIIVLAEVFSRIGCRYFQLMQSLAKILPEYQSIILINLLPLVMTIISIVVTFTHNEICGIPLNKYQNLCNYRFYSLLHIFIITIISFLLYFVFNLTKLKISIIALETGILALSFVFGLQQLRIFGNSKKSAEKIIICNYDLVDSRLVDDKDNDSDGNLYNKLLRNYVVNYGVKCLYGKLVSVGGLENNNVGKTIILMDLLSLKYDYFKKTLGNKENLTKVENIEGLINCFASDLVFVFKNKNSNNILKDSYSSKVFDFLHLLHELYSLLKLEDEEQKIYSSIFNSMELDNRDTITLLKFAFSNVIKDKTWFLEHYREHYKDDLFVDANNNSFQIFISLLIRYLLENSKDSRKTKIYTFINQPINKTSKTPTSSKKFLRGMVDFMIMC